MEGVDAASDHHGGSDCCHRLFRIVRPATFDYAPRLFTFHSDDRRR
jgi:hypothetical protein